MTLLCENAFLFPSHLMDRLAKSHLSFLLKLWKVTWLNGLPNWDSEATETWNHFPPASWTHQDSARGYVLVWSGPEVFVWANSRVSEFTWWSKRSDTLAGPALICPQNQWEEAKGSFLPRFFSVNAVWQRHPIWQVVQLTGGNFICTTQRSPCADNSVSGK